MTVSTEIDSDDEEPDLPEKYTRSELAIWRRRKTKQESPSSGQIVITSNAHGLLRSSEQHQQGLSVFMKRYRRDIITKPEKPELLKRPKSSLPTYLQDVERYNFDLMNHVRPEEHCTLPSRKTIEEEKRRIENEGKKLWSAGRILHHDISLVDPNWKKGMEEKWINQRQKETRQKVAHVILGVLQQWKETEERGAGADPITPDPTSQAEAFFSHKEEKSKKPMAADNEKDFNDRQVLETVPEDEEENIQANGTMR